MRLSLIPLLVGALALSACDDDPQDPTQQGGALDGDLIPDGTPNDAGPGPDARPDAEPGPTASFKARAGVDRLSLWGAPAEVAVEALDADGAVYRTGTTDPLGSLLMREVPPGTYSLRLADTPDDAVHDLVVLGPDNSLPDVAFYANQRLTEGFGYLTVRDGTTLSAYVFLPGPAEDGPYPTVVNYSGYSPSRPGEALGGPADALCNLYPILCAAPESPSLLLAGLMGYAVVGVNMRGTGCSGGAYDFFDTAQRLDGYDIVEIVARQPWVKHQQVGLVGLSFPGISQLFVAAEQPPSLAAISPMSVISDTYTSTLVPGGVYNLGFALSWIDAVLDRAAPYGHRWIQARVDAGDTVCEENQLLHAQRLDATAKALANPYYSDAVARPVDPTTFVGDITVPVFLTGQWQDEQTGPHFAGLADKFTGAPVFRMVATNGVHIDGFSPQSLRQWASFLDLYVDRRVPGLDPTLESVTPLFMEAVYGSSIPLPPNPYAELGDDYAAAKAAFEAQAPIQIIFESGAHPDVAPAAPAGTFALEFDAWPPPSTVAQRWYLQPDGSLGDTPPVAEDAASAFEHDPAAGDRVTLASGSVDDVPPDWAYAPLVDGHALAFESAPLEADVVMVGHGSVDLWLRSTATDADLEVSLTEIRADGEETLVQNGWLRASHRALRDDATELRPIKSHYAADIAPLVPGEWVEARVEIMPFGHVFRAGSRLRLSVDTPGDSQARWQFILTDFGDTPPTHTIGHDAMHPSSVVLPIIPDVEVPSAPPACGALRGQPCRAYVPLVNPPAP